MSSGCSALPETGFLIPIANMETFTMMRLETAPLDLQDGSLVKSLARKNVDWMEFILGTYMSEAKTTSQKLSADL